ncbi:MAG: 30S ribosomal protein S15 [Candidatus Pacebacteria bacterium]|nr:30S ribosomal protein S15 [Candidatus Paceibacterota bacterium]
MLTKEQKEEVIKDVKLHKDDTGSAAAQIALLSEEIKELLSHLKKHPKDLHSKHGLLKMVIKRKKLLKYLEKTDKKLYSAIIKKVGLKEKA